MVLGEWMSGWMGECMDRLMDGWVDGGAGLQLTAIINLNLAMF